MRRCICALLLACVRSDDTLITTPWGPVQGVAFPTHRFWGGIPYGAPPVDALRWQPSSLVAPWTRVINATQDPVGCPQICVTDEPPHICPVKQSEDCLYLNVFAPLTPPSAPVPVLFFAHGGNFHDGYAVRFVRAPALAPPPPPPSAPKKTRPIQNRVGTTSRGGSSTTAANL